MKHIEKFIRKYLMMKATDLFWNKSVINRGSDSMVSASVSGENLFSELQLYDSLLPTLQMANV